MLIIILAAVGALMALCLLICITLGVAAARADRASEWAYADLPPAGASPSLTTQVSDANAAASVPPAGRKERRRRRSQAPSAAASDSAQASS